MKQTVATAPKAGPDIRSLSFIQDRKRGGLLFWNVRSSGSYASDCELGGRLAVEYLTYEEEDADGPGLLQHIVGDMPRDLTGVEIAFLQLVAFQAKVGRGRARQINDYWSRCNANEEAA